MSYTALFSQKGSWSRRVKKREIGHWRMILAGVDLFRHFLGHLPSKKIRIELSVECTIRYFGRFFCFLIMFSLQFIHGWYSSVQSVCIWAESASLLRTGCKQNSAGIYWRGRERSGTFAYFVKVSDTLSIPKAHCSG